MNRKHFTRGNGRLDAGTLNGMMSAALGWSEQADEFTPPAWQGPHLAIIKGNEVITEDLKWKYELEFITPGTTTWTNDEGEVKTLADGDPLSTCWDYVGMGTDEGVYSALNTVEIGNTDTNIMGVDPTNLPEGFKLQPVPTGAFVWCLVGFTPYTEDGVNPGDNGDLILFQYANTFDGAC